MRKPYYWKKRGGWYVKDDQLNNVFLAVDEAEAYSIWNEWRQNGLVDSPSLAFMVIADLFLCAVDPDAEKPGREAITKEHFVNLKRYLNSFCAEVGRMSWRELKPHHVNGWLRKRKSWGPSSERLAIACVKRALNWAVAEGYIDRNPLASVTRPTAVSRDVEISDRDHALLMESGDNGRESNARAACFRPVLIALKHTGQRPGSICRVDVGDVLDDGSAWVIGEHKTRKKTGRPLVVHLSPCMQTLTKILKADREDGPLFRNSLGQRWKSNAIGCRFKRLRKKLGLPESAIAYAYRHSFATNALVNGVDVATVAELLGHGDIQMIQKVYGHLARKSEHLKAAAAKAVKVG